ncbi:MAG: CrcB family protein [Actinomycetota bacterium]
MTTVAAFVMLALVGTVVRAVVTANPPPGSIPWRTLALNCAGAFVLGWLLGSPLRHPSTAMTVALLGSLTTFSTVAGETSALLDDGHKRTAIAYVGLTLVVGITAARLGLELGAP